MLEGVWKHIISGVWKVTEELILSKTYLVCFYVLIVYAIIVLTMRFHRRLYFFRGRLLYRVNILDEAATQIQPHRSRLVISNDNSPMHIIFGVLMVGEEILISKTNLINCLVLDVSTFYLTFTHLVSWPVG